MPSRTAAGGRRARGHHLHRAVERALVRLRGVQDEVEDDRRPAEVRHPFVRDRVVDGLRLHPAQAHAGARDRRQGPREAPAVAVKHRQRPEVHRVVGHVPRDRVRHRVEIRAAVAVDHSLRVPGRAGGVVEGEGVPFVLRRPPREPGVPGGEERLVLDVAEPFAARRVRVVDIDDERPPFDLLEGAHVAEHDAPREAGMRLLKLKIDLVEVVLGVIDQGEVRGPVVGDLPGQLCADGAAGAGDADPPAIDQGAHGGAVRRGLRPAEQVLQADRPHVDVARVAGTQIGELRQAGKRQGDRLAVREQGAEAVRVRTGFREHCALRPRSAGAEPAHDLRQLGRRPQNPNAVDVTPGLARVVVHDADDAVVRGRAPRRRADEELGIVAGPQQQHRYAPRSTAAAPQYAGEAAVQDRPVDDPRPDQERNQDEPVDEEGRARITLQAGSARRGSARTPAPRDSRPARRGRRREAPYSARPPR